MFPAERGRGVGVVHRLTVGGEVVGCSLKGDGVPEGDRAGHEGQTRCSVALVFEGTVTDFAESVGEHDAGCSVSCFAFV